MALLFTFVLFGSSLIWSAFTVWSLAAAVFAVLVLVVRPLAFSLALARTRLPRYDKVLISWFGPRGLSTLLLVLLPVFAGMEGGAQMFAICSLVVLLSVVVHGGTLMLVGKGRRGDRGSQGGTALPAVGEVAPLSRMSSPAAVASISPDGIAGDGAVGSLVPPDGRADGIVDGTQPPDEDSEADEQDRISVAQLRMLQQEGQPVVVVDARTERTFDGSELQAPGAVRIIPGAGGTAPGSIVDQALQSRIPREAWVAVFCA